MMSLLSLHQLMPYQITNVDICLSIPAFVVTSVLYLLLATFCVLVRLTTSLKRQHKTPQVEDCKFTVS